jgi:hypothetical protein
MRIGSVIYTTPPDPIRRTKIVMMNNPVTECEIQLSQAFNAPPKHAHDCSGAISQSDKIIPIT